ncbi:MAG: helix-hairpin-helix domain-containing protein [Oscillospiraceae bacterium]|nr:helix-hairpin-helix domain-containing protein [Oscillospiraceae bacterium]
MNEENKITGKDITVYFILFMAVLSVMLCVIMSNSPKYQTFPYASKLYTDEIGEYSDISEGSYDGIFPIDINTATFEELQLIPDIGPSTAKLIIDYRNELGTVLDFDEFLSIDGIGTKTVEKLKEYCTIN